MSTGATRVGAAQAAPGRDLPSAPEPRQGPADPAHKAIDEAASRMQRTVARVISRLEGNNSDTGAYAELLSGVGGQLSDGADERTVRLLVASLMQATKSIVEKNQRLQEELTVSTAQLSLISRELGEARREAWTDALTGLANRARFDLEIDEAIKDATRDGAPLCLAMLDVDHFKRFNDTHGHTIGDEVLRLMGRILRQTLKGQDTPARYGGEEFAIILPDTALSDAVSLANRLRERISASALRNKGTGESYGVITVSLGVAKLRRGERAEGLIKRADAALYAAKAAGRDRVVAES